MFRKRQTEPEPEKHIPAELLGDLPPELRIVIDMAQLLSRESRRPQNTDQCEAMLKSLGHAELNVRRALVFVPIAFCNDVFGRMGIRSTDLGSYLILKENTGEYEERRLEDEIIYRAACSSVSFVIEHFGNECFLRIAGMSSGMDALNKMLRSGETVESIRGSTVSPTVIPESLIRRRLGR